METNAKMRLVLGQLSKKAVIPSISHKLLHLLDKGLECESDCVILSSLKNTAPNASLSHFEDKTGYECFIKKIHIDDYVEEDFLLNGILFIREILIMNSRKRHIKLILSTDSYSSDGYPSFVVCFHTMRKNESWLGNDLDGYLDALLVFDSECCADYSFLGIDSKGLSRNYVAKIRHNLLSL